MVSVRWCIMIIVFRLKQPAVQENARVVALLERWLENILQLEFISHRQGQRMIVGSNDISAAFFSSERSYCSFIYQLFVSTPIFDVSPQSKFLALSYRNWLEFSELVFSIYISVIILCILSRIIPFQEIRPLQFCFSGRIPHPTTAKTSSSVFLHSISNFAQVPVLQEVSGL